MKIETISVKMLRYDELSGAYESLRCEKSLPILSVVQPLEGSYEIRIDTQAPFYTVPAMGVFVAPPDKMQYIIHHNDPRTNHMRAHWLFLDVCINDCFRISDCFDFPTVLPSVYGQPVYETIHACSRECTLCQKLAEIYKLLHLLIKSASPKEIVSSKKQAMEEYISKNLSSRELLTPAAMATAFDISEQTLYRYFRSFFGLSSSRLIKKKRLERSAQLLVMSDLKVSAIADQTGFYDVSELSRCFKEKYGMAPQRYRQQLRRALP